jgi:hypothetical protein
MPFLAYDNVKFLFALKLNIEVNCVKQMKPCGRYFITELLWLNIELTFDTTLVHLQPVNTQCIVKLSYVNVSFLRWFI